ncbi:uncharacterized protein LOC115233723 [Formica exsecta]|uniref:uncharacterized protein LOC115233723 n=1 Tax=Formica exsecta TaxID=72781 RepID=UPI0011430DFF|nr:uncharacterized protein LOC115233723 [Formica exsecta]
MEHNFKYADAYEKEVYQRYVDKCKVFYAGSTMVIFFTGIVLIITPLIMPDQILPIEAKYPFDVKHEPMKTIVFLHQTIVICQAFSNVCHCSLIGLFIWFTTARFEILSHQFRRVTGIYDIIAGIRQHIKLLSTNVAHAIYESLWYNKDATFQRSLLFILFRSQIPVVVSVSSMLPVLSLNYYASYVSTAFSYLMTLRVIFIQPKN